MAVGCVFFGSLLNSYDARVELNRLLSEERRFADKSSNDDIEGFLGSETPIADIKSTKKANVNVIPVDESSTSSNTIDVLTNEVQGLCTIF